jgi:co-chaperonin GroES (HSP10)
MALERIYDDATGLLVRVVETPEEVDVADVRNRTSAALTDEQMEQALPHPVGYKILVTLPKVDDKFEGTSIQKVDTTRYNEQITSVVALVLEVGPDAYQDKERYPSGPWCKVGDYVLIGPYKGQRFILNNQEFRIMNEDTIEGVVPDPRGYRRI